MSATNFNTRNDTYRKLMGNGLTYRVPPFQRDYSWDEEEWEDLWADILGTVKPGGEPSHYMGYLVLQSADDKLFDIIDGQQRLTTLSLIVLAALRNLKRLAEEGRDVDNTTKRIEGLRQTYIGYLDPVTLIPRSKLALNRNNDDYYQTYLVPLAEHLPQRGFKASEHALRKSFEWFDRKMREHVKADPDPGLAIAQLIDSMSDRLFFTVITVADQLNAYKVFETLNARGVRLSATDLLKNYLFSVLHREAQHPHEMKTLDDRWERIVGRLAAESFPDFLRVHWISRRGFSRQTDLFKTIRGQITERPQVFALLSGMEEDVDTYLALTDPDGSALGADAKDAARLLKMFSVRQPFPLLMTARRRLDDADFAELMTAIVAISFRYNIIGALHSSLQESVYHAEAMRIASGEHATLRPILDGLRQIYPSDQAFKAAFTDKSIPAKQSRTRRIARYILAELERKHSGNATDFESLTLEHICPTNPTAGWDSFSDAQIEELTARIGNMALLPAGKNQDLGNAAFAEKRAIYEASPYALTRSVATDNTEWTPECIVARQRQFANLATSIWRISQLS